MTGTGQQVAQLHDRYMMIKCELIYGGFEYKTLCEYVYSQLREPRSNLDPIRAIKAQGVEQRCNSTHSQP
jgi:hypothetical protein